MPERMNRQWLLARRPHGMVSVEGFQLVERPMPEIGEGQVLVRNLYLSCDPASADGSAVTRTCRR
jgi:NADPH-dependent curcumin reductase CurA